MGVSEGNGSACTPELDATCFGALSYPTRLMQAEVMSGTAAVNSFAHLPPGSMSSSNDATAAIAAVTGSAGAVGAAGGELRQRVAFYVSRGFDSSQFLSIAATYRSFEVDWWRVSGDPVATTSDPFGPGWRASWGDRLLEPSDGGAPVTRVDQYGATWTHLQDSTEPVSFPGAQSVYLDRVYGAQGGSRLILEHFDIGGVVTPIWFRELPDRTRIQYEPLAPGGDEIIARVYRGDFDAPDWQVIYQYVQEELATITDARGLVYTFHWQAIGAVRRVARISVAAPWSYPWSSLDTTFEYELAAPHRLRQIHKPARTFQDDSDRDGTYDPAETYNAPLVTHYVYVANSNRIDLVYDESLGYTRQWLDVDYDSAVPWRVSTLRAGEPGTWPAGQGQRAHSFSYESSPDVTVWTDPRGVVRRMTYDTSFGASPRKWRVTRIEETPGPNDVRPNSDPDYHGTLVWEYGWSCTCGRVTSATLPSGLRYDIIYDSDGRGLPTMTSLTPVGQGTPQQVRTWQYTAWNHADYRLASRLTMYTDALGKSGTNTYVFDGGVGGYRVTGSFAGVDLFTVQEDAAGRVHWIEEPTFAVEGGGTSKNRVGFVYGSSPSSPDYRLLAKTETYDNATVVANRTYSYDGAGFPSAITDELARTFSFAHDVTGWLRTVTLPVTASGRGTATYAATITFQYDRSGRVTSVKRSAHDDEGNPYPKAFVESRRVYDYLGQAWRDFIDRAPMTQAAPDWLVTEHAYDVSGRLLRRIGPAGEETEWLVDDHGHRYQLRRRLDSSTWQIRTFGYHEDGLPARVVDAVGYQITALPDTWGRPEVVTFPGNRRVRWLFDAEDRVIGKRFEVGPAGSAVVRAETAWARDDLGRVSTVARTTDDVSVSRTTTYAYNGPFRVASLTDSFGRGPRYGYDLFGRIVLTSDRLIGSDGNKDIYTRDILGNIQRVEQIVLEQTGETTYVPVVYRTDLVHDAWDRLIGVERHGSAGAVQATRRRGYDSLWRATWTMDGVGKQTRRAFDALGRLMSEFHHQRDFQQPAIQLSVAYDDSPVDPTLARIVTRMDGNGNTSEYFYDLLGRMRERRLPGYDAGTGAHRWSYIYDLEGGLLGWTDGNGTQVEQIYDNLGRRSGRRAKQLPSSGVVLSRLATGETWTHDDHDRMVSAQTWWNVYTAFEAGEPSNLIEVLDPLDGFGRSHGETFRYLDDPNPGYQPLASKSTVSGYSIPGGGEDPWLRRSFLTATGWTVGLSPDDLGRIGTMTLAGPGSTAQSLATYRYVGNRTLRRTVVPGMDSAKALETLHSFDELRNLTSTVTTFDPAGSGTGIFDIDLERDVEGNVTQLRYNKTGGAAGDWIDLDGWERLREAKLGVASFSGGYAQATFDTKLEYVLDSVHNRSSVLETDGPSGTTTTTTYTSTPGTNRYASVGGSPYTYDWNGNLISDGYFVYVYDYLDRLSEAYVITYPAGAPAAGGRSASTQPVTLEQQRARQGVTTDLTVGQAGPRARGAGVRRVIVARHLAAAGPQRQCRRPGPRPGRTVRLRPRQPARDQDHVHWR